MEYNLVVCGGTFDRLHSGHKAFLMFAFSISRNVHIGLTSQKYLQTYKPAFTIEDFEVRRNNLVTFLRENHWEDNANIIPIDDVYGLTLHRDIPYEAIIATQSTKSGAEIINEKRKQSGLQPLRVVLAPLLMSANGVILSSSLIREGKVGREGQVFLSPEWTKHSLSLPTTLRGKLKIPFGEVFTKDIPLAYTETPDNIVTVGDATTKRFNDIHIGQALSVVDFAIERKKVIKHISDLGFGKDMEIVHLTNPAGNITYQSWEVLENILTSKSGKRKIVVVEGEEDLLVIPLILLLPLGYCIFYGQPGVGVVCVRVTEEAKEQTLRLLHELMKQ